MNEAGDSSDSNDGDVALEFSTNPAPSRRRSLALFHSVGGWNVVELSGFASDPMAAAVHRLLVMVLLIVLRDHATALTFEPHEFDEDDGLGSEDKIGFRMCYEVEGQAYDLVRPPRHLRRFIAREIEHVAGMRSLPGRLAHRLDRLANWLQGFESAPRWGRFRIALDDVTSDVEVWSWRVALGDVYQLRFRPVTKELSDRADGELRTIMRLRGERRANAGTSTDLTNEPLPGG
jgi:hypothetical protein